MKLWIVHDVHSWTLLFDIAIDMAACVKVKCSM